MIPATSLTDKQLFKRLEFYRRILTEHGCMDSSNLHKRFFSGEYEHPEIVAFNNKYRATFEMYRSEKVKRVAAKIIPGKYNLLNIECAQQSIEQLKHRLETLEPTDDDIKNFSTGTDLKKYRRNIHTKRGTDGKYHTEIDFYTRPILLAKALPKIKRLIEHQIEDSEKFLRQAVKSL